ncbi:hypothetical protein E4N95_11130 [Treponema denticola]|uniref:hypothetical protein n=1 Tax=Treponema denticola TaxID=158 RepID=UPI003D8F8CFA
MEIKKIELYEGRFFGVRDEKKGDEYFDFFTTYDEALRSADYQWCHMTDYDKRKNRRMSVFVSNTAKWPDTYDELCSSDDDFIEVKNRDELIAFYKMQSNEEEFEKAQKKALAEKALFQQKEKHRREMEKQNALMAALKNSTDIEKCIWWRDHDFPHPSGDEIVRIKKETGLSWTEFKYFLKNL